MELIIVCVQISISPNPQWNHSVFSSKIWLDLNYQSSLYLSDGYLWIPVGIRHQGIWKWAQITHCPQLCNPRESDYSADIEKVFLEQCLEVLRSYKIDFVRQSPTHVHFKSYPAGSQWCEFGSFGIDLTRDESELWDRVHQKHRNVIRKAEKDGVQIEFGPQVIEECLQLFRSTLLERSQVGMHSESWFRTLIQEMPQQILCGIARYQGEAQGAVFMPWNSQGCYYLYGGSSAKPHGGAMNLLHWQGMLRMKSQGVRYYDFVGARISPVPGSKYEGMQRFKERFGAELFRGYLWKINLRPMRTRLYDFIYRLKHRHSIGDIIDQEVLRKQQQGLVI